MGKVDAAIRCYAGGRREELARRIAVALGVAAQKLREQLRCPTFAFFLFTFYFFPHVFRERPHVPRRVHQLQHARHDEGDVGLAEGGGWEDRELVK